MNRAAHSLVCFATIVSLGFLGRPVLAQAAPTTTTTTLSYSPGSPAFGSPVILTATVTPGSPTGSVTFYDGAMILGDASVVGNTARLTTTTLTPGVHSLRAHYNGDTLNSASLSAKVPATVTGGAGGSFNAAGSLTSGTTPVDVESGDLNHDGKSDLVVVNQGDNSISVYLGNGDGTFQAPVTYSVGTTPSAAVITDVDGDGFMDIVVANQGTNTLSVLIGNGLGNFQPAVAVVTLSGPHSIVVGDFNGDGRPDLAVTSTNHGSVAVHLNSGATGFFDPFTTSTTPGTTKGIATGDFNGDGFADLAVANYSTTNNYVTVFLGHGDGTFGSPVNYVPGTAPVAIVAADLNGDGHTDLAVANKTDNTVSVFLGTGTGTFNTSVAYPAGAGPANLIAVDVSGDLRPDILVTDNAGNTISVLVDNANGTLQSATTFTVGSGPRSLVAGSFNGDSFVDLAVVNQSDAPTNGVSILIGVPSTTTALTVSPNPASPGVTVTLTATVNPSTASGSVNFYDGGNLLANATVVNGVASYSSAAFTDGSHTLTATFIPSGADSGSTSAPVVLLVQQATTITLAVAPATAVLGQPVTFTAVVSPNTVTGSVSFFDHNSIEIGTAPLVNAQAVLTTSILGAGSHSITARYSGDVGDQTSISASAPVTVNAAPAGGYGTASATYSTGTAPDAVVLGDFNQDGVADLAVANYSSGTVSIFLGAGSGAFSGPVNYAVGVNPVAIAMGDFNNDGKMDLVVSDNGSVNVSLLTGVGDGTFNAPIYVPAGTLPLGIAVADFNGDGFLDIAVVDSGTNQVSIIPGNGDGTFQNAVNITIAAGGLRAITVGDFNADGKVDIAVTGTSGVYVMFGNGNYSFGSPISYPTGTGAFAVTTGDFNGDGKLDLVVVNSQNNNVSVLLSGTNGSFLPASNYPVGTFPQSAVTGDFNGDGFLDIAVANESSNNVSVLYGNGLGGFQPASSYATGSAPVALAAGSFNASGQTDLAVVNYQNNSVGIYLALLGSSVTLNVSPNPDPAGVPVTFTATVTPSAATGSVTFFDGVNTVGVAPLVNSIATFTASLPAGVQTLTAVYSGDSIYGQSTSAPVSDTVAQGSVTTTLTATPNPATLGQPVTLTASVNSVTATGLVTFYNGVMVLGTAVLSGGQAQFTTSALPAGSLNLYARYDGDVNNASSASAAFPLVVAAGHGFGLGNPTAFPVGTAPVSVAAADFNLDGRTDLAAANSGSNTLSILNGNGDGTFSAGVTLNTGTAPTQVQSADFNGDGKADLIVANSVSNNVTVFTGNGDGTFSTGTNYGAGTAPSSLVVADFNNDGKADVVVANATGGSVSFIYGDGDGSLGTTSTIPVGVSNSYVTAGDFNNDGNADIAVADTSGNVVWILLGLGNGQFQAPVSFAVGTTPESIAVGDFNGDGKLDLAVANNASANVTVLLGNGDGTFQTEVPYPSGAQTQSVSVGDLNGDGILDLVVASQAGNVSVLIGNGNGTFQNAVSFAAGATPVSVVVNNFNGDGTDQVAVANKTVNTVSVLLDSAATLTPFAGNNQSAFVGSPYANPLQVLATGFGVPVAGVTVTFTLPASGASAVFAGTGLTATAVTGFNGVATSPQLIANGTAGAFSPIASVGTASVPFSLTNQTSSCTFSVTGGPLAYDSNGGSATLNVTTSPALCTWGASTDSASWITLSTTGGTGNGSVMVTIAPNNSGAPRSGNVFVAGKTFPVTETLTTQIFADVPPSAYYFDSANLLYAKGITSGCSTNPLDYCPTELVTRAQMAIFVVRSIYGGDNFTSSPTPYFNDVPVDSFGFAWIQKLYELKITTGCGNGDYCPDSSITRAQMAVFIISARLGATLPFDYNPTPYFTDVPANGFAFSWIQRMKQDQITAGCAPTLYCPNSPVNRGDMSLFIMHGLFNELLPAGTPVITAVSPSTLALGQGTTMTVTGANTHFQQGLSAINPIPGVTFGTPTVISATQLTVPVTVTNTALQQPWPIEVITGTEEAVLPNSFTIQ